MKEIQAIIPIGHFCHCSNHFKNNNLKLYSLPFDWIRCSIPAIKHIIKDDFKIFMDKKLYLPKAKFWNHIIPCVHTFYSKEFTGTRLFNHHNPSDDKDYKYFERCVARFRQLKSDKLNNKLFVRMDFCNNINKNKIDNEILDLNLFLSKYFSNFYILIIKLYKDFDYKTDIISDGNITILFQSYASSTNGIYFENKNDTIELHNSINNIYKFNLLKIESFK